MATAVMSASAKRVSSGMSGAGAAWRPVTKKSNSRRKRGVLINGYFGEIRRICPTSQSRWPIVAKVTFLKIRVAKMHRLT
jgi:hypothetical protein